MKRPAYAYISHLERIRNGRAVIKALHAHYEGELAMRQIKAQAYKMKKNATYSGEKENWMIKMYITFQKKAIKF